MRGERHAVERALLAAEARAEALGRPVVYAGLCGTRCANRSKVALALTLILTLTLALTLTVT